MSYLPPNAAGYFEAVQVYFTEATGRMALFGARDRDLLEQWKQQGRPARLICRGIREAVESYGTDDPPRSLAQCEPFVDEEWERFEHRDVGAHDDTDSDDAGDDEDVAEDSSDDERGELFHRVRRAIERAGKSVNEERWRRAYRRAWRRMNELSGEFAFPELEAVDEALVQGYLEALDEEERQRIEEALGSMNASLLQGMSPVARRQHLHMKRKRELIEQFGLVDLFEVV